MDNYQILNLVGKGGFGNLLDTTRVTPPPHYLDFVQN